MAAANANSALLTTASLACGKKKVRSHMRRMCELLNDDYKDFQT